MPTYNSGTSYIQPAPAAAPLPIPTPPPAPPTTWNLNGMLFDAWLRMDHNTSLTITQHPVETGAAISDHSYINPRRFSFDIGMSDVALSVIPVPGQAAINSGNQSKSINAYQALVSMQNSRQLLTLTSKYGYFNNILIESIDAPDDFHTREALHATINLVQIIMASNSTANLQFSANPQATDITNSGQQAGTPPRPNYAQAAAKWLGSVVGSSILKGLGF